MGSGARQYRIALGQATGEAKAIQDHQLAMIPIMQKQAEMELEIQKKAFAQELEIQEKTREQEIEQAKKMNLLSQKLQLDPILMPAQVDSKKFETNYLVYAGIAILAFFLLRK